MTIKDFIIIGGGIAGFSAIKAIREEDKQKTILWISNEDRIPYKRTKINKNIASGFSKNDFAILTHDWLVENHIELLYDNVEKIEANKHEIFFQHRGNLRYHKLIIATGCTPNVPYEDQLPPDKIHHIYTARQSENIIRTTSKNKKYLVIGAGVEGIETAEQLIKLKKEVVLIDKADRVMSQFLTTSFSKSMENSIRKSGIQLLLNTKKFTYQEGDNEESLLNIDNTKYEFDTIVSTVGYTPNIKLAHESNIDCAKGILVNDELETSAQDIFAAGDVAENKNGYITNLWHAAEEQGFIAGKNALGLQLKVKQKPYRMKTEVFNEFYFSVPPKSNHLELISENNSNITRDMYFEKDKLKAILMKNDKTRAKEYQLALMEEWSLYQIHKVLPI